MASRTGIKSNGISLDASEIVRQTVDNIYSLTDNVGDEDVIMTTVCIREQCVK